MNSCHKNKEVPNNFFILYIFISLPLFFFTVFFTFNIAFEQGHLEPWRYINAFIIIIIIIIIT